MVFVNASFIFISSFKWHLTDFYYLFISLKYSLYWLPPLLSSYLLSNLMPVFRAPIMSHAKDRAGRWGYNDSGGWE